MEAIDFFRIHQAIENAEFSDCDLVVGIGEGGIVPAALIAAKKGHELRIVRFNYRNEKNIPQHPEPLLLDRISIPKNIKHILLVDDVSMSGKTMQAARTLFKDYNIKTLVLKGKADYVLLPELKSCVKWPWSR